MYFFLISRNRYFKLRHCNDIVIRESRPYAGAWIETPGLDGASPSRSVAPLCGHVVETLVCAILIRWFSSHLHAGAWIATFLWINMLKLSHARMRCVD